MLGPEAGRHLAPVGAQVQAAVSQSTELRFFGIVLAVRNGAATLRKCLASIASQTFRDFELVVVDGLSGDATPQILREHRWLISRWIREGDEGIYDAFNKGVQASSATWMYFLGADDCLRGPAVLDEVAARIRLLPTPGGVVYGRVDIVDEGDSILATVGEPWSKTQRRLADLMALSHQGIFACRRLFETIGPFDTSFLLSGDYEWLLRVLETETPTFLGDVIVAAVRRGGVSSQPENSLRLLFELRRASACHGRRWPGAPWLAALARVLVRKALVGGLGPRGGQAVVEALRKLLR